MLSATALMLRQTRWWRHSKLCPSHLVDTDFESVVAEASSAGRLAADNRVFRPPNQYGAFGDACDRLRQTSGAHVAAFLGARRPWRTGERGSARQRLGCAAVGGHRQTPARGLGLGFLLLEATTESELSQRLVDDLGKTPEAAASGGAGKVDAIAMALQAAFIRKGGRVSGLSTIAEQVTSGVERLGRREELMAQLRRIDAVEKASSELVLQLKYLTETVGVARAAGFVPPLPDAAAARGAVDRLRGQLANGDVDREFAQGVIDSIGSLIREAKESLTTAWRTYVGDRIPSPEGLLVLADAFSAVEGASAFATQPSNSDSRCARFPPTGTFSGCHRKVNELAAEMPHLLQQLVGAEPDVRAFAEQLARGGAGIDALTPSVLKWMEDAGFVGSFKVVAGRPAEDVSRVEH